MNDRFKFRVWDKENKTYLDEDYLWLGSEGYAYDSQFQLSTIDFIIEQCTGLKDKNGKPIFEGDVVKCDIDFVPDGRVGLIRRVVFKDGAFQLISEDGGFYFIMGFHNYEIIGNIHEMEAEKLSDCKSCHGTGYLKSRCDEPDRVCPICNGTGKYEE